MFRMWCKQLKNNQMLKDTVIENDSSDTRTHKILNGVVEACDQWDLSKPIWLDANIQEFQRLRKTRFSQDNFIEEIPFDYLEIQIIDE
ncbi:MAG: hypothetical protein ACOX8H_01540 [Ruminococcus sp.]|jgi:uncharacterized HAD superfamily protein